MERCVELQPQTRARANASRQSPALASRAQRVHEWKKGGRTELAGALFSLTPALSAGKWEPRATAIGQTVAFGLAHRWDAWLPLPGGEYLCSAPLSSPSPLAERGGGWGESGRLA